jgi:5-methylcytosine-specific restriction endonuclease McrA
MRKEKRNPEAYKEICERYQSGETLKTLGNAYGFHFSSIVHILNRYGVKRRNISQSKKGKELLSKRTFDWSEAKRLYESGLTCKEIADVFGIGHSSIWMCLKKQGVQIRNRKETGKVGKYTSSFKHGLYNTREYAKFHKAKRRSHGTISIKIIQSVYEENILKNGTLTCEYCKEPIQFTNDHLEHKIPLCRGGTNDRSNLAISCKHCNLTKSRKTDKEYLEVLNTLATQG